MDKKTTNKTLATFIKNINGHVRSNRILLFGSHACGKETEDSDIDLLVVSDDFKNVDIDVRLNILYKSSVFLKPDIHPWGVTVDEFNKAHPQSLIGYVRKNGKVLK